MNLFLLKFLKKRKAHQLKRLNFLKSLIDSLDLKEPKFYELFDDLDDNYCDCGKLLGNNIYLGCVYMFSYKLKNPSEYNNLKFIDKTPLVLVTGYDKDYVRGINLNLCSSNLRVLILNFLSNLDEKFFDGGYVLMCNEGKKPLSNNVLKFMNSDGETKIIKALKNMYPSTDFGSIFRTYRKTNISKLKFIEWYILPYIPDIEYPINIPNEVLKQYWKLSKISDIKL